MNSQRLRLAVAAALVCCALSAPGEGPEIGKPAPPLNLAKILQAPSDASAKWEALREKVVVVDFWATWCGPCRKSIPHWNELVDAFKGQPVQFIAITDENEQVVEAFLKKTPIHAWIGLDGLGKPMRDIYGIEGIPTTVLVNKKGIVVAVTHPATLQAKHITEILETDRSSLPPPVARPAAASEDDAGATVPVKAVFEVSARRSGPVPRGHGFDCWQASPTNSDVFGQYASVRRAILTLFDCKEPLLDCRTTLPNEQYDFVVRLPSGATHIDREPAVAPMFRSVFGLQIHREVADREVYVMTAVSTNAPGLTLSGSGSRGGGGEERGGLKLGKATMDWLPRPFERWLGKTGL
jgi:thiol-disulfide isomerase/thioredoxin